MTVQDLIDLLKGFDPSLPVYDTDREGSGEFTHVDAFLGRVVTKSRHNICGEVTSIVSAEDSAVGAFECVHVGA